jgi:hypothetical protein
VSAQQNGRNKLDPTCQLCLFMLRARLGFFAKTSTKCGDFLLRKRKVILKLKFSLKSDDFMLLTRRCHIKDIARPLANSAQISSSAVGLRNNASIMHILVAYMHAPWEADCNMLQAIITTATCLLSLLRTN